MKTNTFILVLFILTLSLKLKQTNGFCKSSRKMTENMEKSAGNFSVKNVNKFFYSILFVSFNCKIQKKGAASNEGRKWPNGDVVYQISNEFTGNFFFFFLCILFEYFFLYKGNLFL